MKTNKRLLVNLLTTILIIIAIPLTIVLVSQRQELRKEASASNYLVVSSRNLSIGDILVVNVKNIKPETVFATAQLTIDTNSWEIPSNFSTIKANNAVLFKNGLHEIPAPGGKKTYELMAGAHNSSSPISGDLFQITLKAKNPSPKTTISLKIRTVNKNVSLTEDTTESTEITITQSATPIPTNVNATPQATPAPTTTQAPAVATPTIPVITPAPTPVTSTPPPTEAPNQGNINNITSTNSDLAIEEITPATINQ